MNSDKIKELIKDNSNYWERRALENKLNIIENEEDYIKRISAIYDQANRDIDDKLAAVYTRYAKENNLTLDEAYQILPKKMEKEYKKDINDYIEKAKSGDGKWRQYLLNQSLMHRHSVLDQLRTEMRNVVYNIDIETSGGKFLEKIYANANYYEQFADNNESFAHIDQDKIQRLLKEDWSGGGNFSEAIWKNKEQLVNALDDIVIRGLATGESYDSMADKLAKRMETSKSNARRLIMTESARMDNEGLLAYYKETGVKNLIFVATLDTRTSEICQAMDQQIIPIEEAKIGLNIPPMHPYCRSVISPYYEGNESDTRIYRDKDTGKSTKGEYKDYADYVKSHLGNTEQAEAITSKHNTIRELIKATAILSNDTSVSIPDTDIKELTGYELNREHLEYAKRRNERNYDHYKEQDGITNEDIDKMFKDLKKIIEDKDNEVAIRVKIDALEDILKSGKIVNGFEIDKIHNYIEQYRREAEKDIFNIPFDASASHRPIYGYLRNSDVELGMPGAKLQMYGDIKIVLNDKVKDRCTITLGDSLDRATTIIPSRLNNLKLYSTDYHVLKHIEESGSLYAMYGYPELQIFKKLSLDDIKKVVLPEEYKYNEDLLKLLKKEKIEVEYE